MDCDPKTIRRWSVNAGGLLSVARTASASAEVVLVARFAARLRELGWTEGKNLLIDYRWAAATPLACPPLARELVVLQPDAQLPFPPYSFGSTPSP
jgi:hypothetical protein